MSIKGVKFRFYFLKPYDARLPIIILYPDGTFMYRGGNNRKSFNEELVSLSIFCNSPGKEVSDNVINVRDLFEYPIIGNDPLSSAVNYAVECSANRSINYYYNDDSDMLAIEITRYDPTIYLNIHYFPLESR